MPATADELRLSLVAKIARPRLLALQAHYAPLIQQGERVGITAWRSVYLSECDDALDEAIDAADVAIIAHTDAPEQFSVKV